MDKDIKRSLDKVKKVTAKEESKLISKDKKLDKKCKARAKEDRK